MKNEQNLKICFYCHFDQFSDTKFSGSYGLILFFYIRFQGKIALHKTVKRSCESDYICMSYNWKKQRKINKIPSLNQYALVFISINFRGGISPDHIDQFSFYLLRFQGKIALYKTFKRSCKSDYICRSWTRKKQQKMNKMPCPKICFYRDFDTLSGMHLF